MRFRLSRFKRAMPSYVCFSSPTRKRQRGAALPFQSFSAQKSVASGHAYQLFILSQIHYRINSQNQPLRNRFRGLSEGKCPQDIADPAYDRQVVTVFIQRFLQIVNVQVSSSCQSACHQLHCLCHVSVPPLIDLFPYCPVSALHFIWLPGSRRYTDIPLPDLRPL